MYNLVLASSSHSRKGLLERLQLLFTIHSPDIDETPLINEAPRDLALRLAEQKARAIANIYPGSLIIGADQVIMLGDIRLDKPGTVEIAKQQLSLVSGKQVNSSTGVCLFNARTQNLQLGVENYQVAFRELTPAMIDNYIRLDHPLQCAGSIKAESLGIVLFARMSGRDPTALLGLPLMLLTDMLKNEGINLV